MSVGEMWVRLVEIYPKSRACRVTWPIRTLGRERDCEQSLWK